MKLFFLSLMMICCVFCIEGQQKLSTKSKKASALYREAGDKYMKEDLRSALKLLDQAIAKDKNFIEAFLLSAEIYNSASAYEKQVVMLEKALALDSTYFLPAYYNMGVAKYHLGEYTEAIKWLNKYTEVMKGKKSRLKPARWIQRANFAMQSIQTPRPFEPVSMGDSINSEFDEYWPSLTADESVLVYTVLVPKDTLQYQTEKLPKTPLFFREDFFFSTSTDSAWQARQPLKSINTKNNEGAQSLSADGNWMFFAACGRQDSKGSCDIYFSQRTSQGWTTPVNIGSPVNTPYWESQPSFSSDGRTLYFASGRPGGIGKKDLWKATICNLKPDGTPVFCDVKNLGAMVNSPLDESSPFIHQDNQTLYFSSEGWPGMGNMDLFLSRKDDNGQWQEPENLGHPINTPNDEIGLVINARGSKAYFSSDGLKEERKDKDLYWFNLPTEIRPNPVSYVKGKVFDKETGKQVSASFELKNVANGQLVVASQSTGFSGEFLVCLPAGENYALSVNKTGYLFYSGNFNLHEEEGIEKPRMLNIYLSPIKAGEKIVLENVFFETDSYQLLKESNVELDKLVTLLINNSTLKVEIGGHTDSVGSEAYNMDLSMNRAKSVVQYLLNYGVEADRLTYKGYGFSQPLADNATDAGRAKNRRTEIKVLPN